MQDGGHLSKAEAGKQPGSPDYREKDDGEMWAAGETKGVRCAPCWAAVCCGNAVSHAVLTPCCAVLCCAANSTCPPPLLPSQAVCPYLALAQLSS